MERTAELAYKYVKGMLSKGELEGIRDEMLKKAEKSNNPDDWVDVGYLDFLISRCPT